MSFNKSVSVLVKGRSYPLCVRVGDRGGVAWLCVGTVVRGVDGVEVSFERSRAVVARALWTACMVEREDVRVAAGAPEIAFGAQLEHGLVLPVVSGVVDLRTERVLRAEREAGVPERLSGVGPRAPRSAWPG